MVRYVILLGFVLGACGDGSEDDRDPGPGGYCSDVSYWDEDWVAFEAEVLVLVNEVRDTGYDCDSEGDFGPAPAVIADTTLRCSARKHSVDMVARDFFAHENPDGDEPTDRMVAAGFTNWQATGENIAAGQETPEEVMEDWLESDGHCRNIMDPDFARLGVGYYFSAGSEYDHYWTQNFGTLFSD